MTATRASSGGRLTPKDLDMLDHVAREDVTWQYVTRKRYATAVSYRLWSSEHDYTVVTPRVARLADRGLVERWTGGMWGRGGVELTAAGRKLYARWSADGRGRRTPEGVAW